MSKIVKKKDLDVLIENTMAKAGIIKEEDSKSKFLDAFSGQDPFTMLIVDLMTKLVEKLENSILKDVDLPNKIKASGYNNFDDYYLDKYGKTFTSELEELETSLGNSKPEIKNYLADKIQMLKWSVEEVNKKLNESESNKKPLINENVQKELDRFNRLSNYTFKK